MDTLFFVLAKLVWALIAPGTWLVAGLILVLVALRRGRIGLARGVAAVLLGFVLVISTLPLGEALLRPLETRYPVAPALDDPTGIIVLGGGEHAARSDFWGRPELGEGAERFTAALALARQYPQARVLFTGGSGALRDIAGRALSGADVAAAVFAEQGLDPDRLVLERASRNTAENAIRSIDLVQPVAGERWVLITSAFHMPRAMASFERAGWTGLVAWPVDFRSAALRRGIAWDFSGHLQTLSTALHEHLGLVAYRLSNR